MLLDRYSSVVALRLMARRQEYPLAQAASDFVILKTPAAVPAGPATIVMVVDGRERRWEVVIPESAGAAERIRTQLV